MAKKHTITPKTKGIIMDVSINYIGLIMATILFILTPGLGVALILSRTVSDGFIRGYVVGIGLFLGDLTYAILVLLAFTGLANIVMPYLPYVRILGAVYLVYLGIKQMRKGAISLTQNNVSVSSIWRDLGLYWMISLTNPKVIVFYIGFLPLFLPLGYLNTTQTIQTILALVFAGVVSIGLTVGFAMKLKTALIDETTAPMVNKCIGGLMCLVGVWLVV